MYLRGFVDGFVDGYFANFEEQGRRNFTMPAKNPDCSKNFGFRCPPQSVAPCGALLPSEGTLKTNCMQHVYVKLRTPEKKKIMAEYRNQMNSRYSPQGVRALQCSSTVTKE